MRALLVPGRPRGADTEGAELCPGARRPVTDEPCPPEVNLPRGEILERVSGYPVYRWRDGRLHRVDEVGIGGQGEFAAVGIFGERNRDLQAHIGCRQHGIGGWEEHYGR